MNINEPPHVSISSGVTVMDIYTCILAHVPVVLAFWNIFGIYSYIYILQHYFTGSLMCNPIILCEGSASLGWCATCMCLTI